MSFLSRLLHSAGDQAASVDAAEASRRQAGGALVIDVRENDEWRAGHVPGARLIPLGQVPARVADIPKDGEVLLICRSGNRSGQAQRWLQAQGYRNVTNVTGGMNGWTRAGLPVQR